MTVPDPWRTSSFSDPNFIQVARHEFAPIPSGNNFIKSLAWSPDGLCILTNSEDHNLRVFDFVRNEENGSSILREAVCISQGEPIHSTAWFPGMVSDIPESCVFASSSRDHPIKLWDGYHGTLRATYRAYDSADEIASANSLCFSPDGSILYAGYDKAVRIFRLDYPGRECVVRQTAGTRKSHSGLRGIMSCISVSTTGIYACGSFHGNIGIFSEPNGDLLATLQEHCGGITEVKFTQDGNYLVSGARKDGDLLLWDLRKTVEVVHRFPRVSSTNQRIAFDMMSDMYLVTGSTDGRVIGYDLASGAQLWESSWFAGECVGAVGLNPKHTMVASGCGERVFMEDEVNNGELAVYRL